MWVYKNDARILFIHGWGEGSGAEGWWLGAGGWGLGAGARGR